MSLSLEKKIPTPADGSDTYILKTGSEALGLGLVDQKTLQGWQQNFEALAIKGAATLFYPAKQAYVLAQKPLK